MALSTNREQTFSTAEVSAATSNALAAQANGARKAADDAVRAAEASCSDAEKAAQVQSAVVAENAAQREVLFSRLATLHNTTVELEGARVDELERKAQGAALKQQVQASAASPEPVCPANPEQGVPQGQPAHVPKVTAVQPPLQPAPPSAPRPVEPAKPALPGKPVAPPVGAYIDVMVQYALSKQGSPYLLGGNGPNVFDCSGLVQQAFASAGIAVPRTGTDQFWAAPARVPLSQMRYGDLLVFNDSGGGQFGHVAIYCRFRSYVSLFRVSCHRRVTIPDFMSLTFGRVEVE